jgi:hypothetical protein
MVRRDEARVTTAPQVTEGQAPPGGGRPTWLLRAGPVVLFVLLAMGAVAVLQFVFVPVPHDADTAYHAAVGELIRRHGILRAFPWTPFSWLADHYADKELLFHLMFVPLTGLGWMTAAKVVGTLAGATVLVTLFLVLRAEGVRWAGLWAFLPLLASSAFLFRFLLVRPHLLSIALCILLLWAAARGRLLLVAVAAFLYPWTYVAWFLPVLLVLVAEVARVAGGARPGWKALAAAAGGITAGLALHPNGLHLLQFTWLQIGGALLSNAWGGRQGMELGREFEPFSPGEWLQFLALAAAMAVAGLVLAWRERQTSPVPLAFALAAAAFGLATVRTARFAEYLVPLSVASLALGLTGVPARWGQVVPAALAAVALAYQGGEEAALLARLREWPNRVPGYVARAMRAAIPEGAQVFTCEWGLTGYLMLALPERKFIVALDPTFFHSKDPELHQLWYAATRRPPPGVASLVRERFGARYVACFYDPQFEAFNAELARDPSVRTVLVADDWNVYDLGPAR